MITLKQTAVLTIILLFISSCSGDATDGRRDTADPRSVAVTVETEGDFLESISDLNGLTVGEVQLLFGYLMRHDFGAALGSEQESLVGKTIGEMIHAQRAFAAEQVLCAEQEKQMAAEAKAKNDARARLLQQTITLTVYEKGFFEADYDDYIRIKCTYENKSQKDVRAFQGILRFNDLFGDLIYQSSLKISDPVAPGAQGTWIGSIDYNQFVDEHKALRNTDLEDMRIEWIPATIIFADGTILGEQ
ncbi:MAG: hypothetical protein KAY24_08390 [Candidatus Eisenbacteria sp.]|nr:hypothetical protein [Candidatus Eisenbacteria bacterium]